MNLLNKFENVKIDTLEFIDAEDQTICKGLENECIRATESVDSVLNLLDLNPFKNQYYNNWELVKQLESGKKGMIIKFANDIKKHFESKYNVTIFPFDAEGFKKIDYVEIVDDIIARLGGFDFKEKAYLEIKKNIEKNIYLPHVNVKNINIRIKSFIAFEPAIFKVGFWNLKSDRTLKEPFYALEYFESKSVTLRKELDAFRFNNSRDNWFEPFIFESMTKIREIKFFKNNSIQLKFDSNASAIEFAKTFLKYSESVLVNSGV